MSGFLLSDPEMIKTLKVLFDFVDSRKITKSEISIFRSQGFSENMLIVTLFS